MLGKAMRKYVMDERKAGYDKQKRTVYDGRLKKYAADALKDLTLLAKKLPEEQQSEIFNENSMEPFLKALLVLPTLRQDDSEERRADMESRRKRVIGLWRAIFQSVAFDYGLKLVGKETWRIFTLEKPETLEAIYYATRFG